MTGGGNPQQVDVCVYNGSGRLPLAYSIGAFLLLAVAMFAEHGICFGLAEVLLMIGIGVESGHLSDWNRPHPVCHRVRPGMFAAAGILGLVTVVVGFVVYVTAVQARKLQAGQYHGAPYPYPAPYPGPSMTHPHPAPHPAPSAPGAPETRPAACQVEPSRASLITKEITDVCV
ncbi:hypothetical protein PR202_ga23862 [Eleusine coracana subsp. coracana]|uniref:Uncharacterized protein n=1 Tax=Eleusine coracana subsp. coracana TaxID=191504 RepID=A0AAV5D715_ELECO|nr:hypothetical protein PR202_ga23862 [Eleusine coracana subsp. coracana]